MTLDELLIQLMKIKEVYPDAGKMVIMYKDNTDDDYIECERVKVNTDYKEIEFE